MSDLQRDIERIDSLLDAMHPHGKESKAAWQRLKPRLTPDRERVKKAMRDVMIYHTGDEESLREQLADAAIKAMGEP